MIACPPPTARVKMRQFPRRSLHLTADLVARVERTEPDSGPASGLTPMSEADVEGAAQALLARNPDAPFWVFAYGSLIWKPAFEPVETRLVRAHGWRRSFCLDIIRWRATPEQPGLMLALTRGGTCSGMAYRLDPVDRLGQMIRLLNREVSYREDLALIRWITCRTGGEALRALTFYAGAVADACYVQLPIEDQVHRLARAAGHVGSCAAYLRNTVEHLEELGIRDSYLWRLQRLVAAEIAGMAPRAAAAEAPSEHRVARRRATGARPAPSMCRPPGPPRGTASDAVPDAVPNFAPNAVLDAPADSS